LGVVTVASANNTVRNTNLRKKTQRKQTTGGSRENRSYESRDHLFNI
jgi:hypothetical protein